MSFSDELWGSPALSSPCGFDFFMPNGTVLGLSVIRDTTLRTIKTELWAQAKNEIMFRLLKEPSSYVFKGVTKDAKTEEFYDESRRICDLRLSFPVLVLTEPRVNAEKMLSQAEISLAVGKPVHELEADVDLEFIECRQRLLTISEQVVNERSKMTSDQKLAYYYPPDLVAEISEYCPTGDNEGLQVTVVIHLNDLVEENTESRIEMICPVEDSAEMIIQKIKDRLGYQPWAEDENVVLKIVGFDEYLLGGHPLRKFKHICQLISQEKEAEFILKKESSVIASIPEDDFLPYHLIRRSSVTCSSHTPTRRRGSNLWAGHPRQFKVQINMCTDSVTKHLDSHVFIRVGVYHGLESLCPEKETKRVHHQNLKWMETIEFDDFNIDGLPRSARLCLSMCSESAKKSPSSIAYANIPIFDYQGRLQAGKVIVNLWKVPTEHSDLLYPLGVTGVNPEKLAFAIEIEFEKPHHGGIPIVFPSDNDILDVARNLLKIGHRNQTDNRRATKGSDEDKARVIDIINRDPLAQLTDDEKDLIFRSRYFCQQELPDSLPKLLESVKWNNRDEVAEVYLMLTTWKDIKMETSLELLDCKFTDPKVRSLAIKNLDRNLPDDILKDYLLQLVQVLLHEPYLSNDLVEFLLRRSLKNRHVGHLFFWLLRAEMHDALNSRICSLVLESFCRGVGHQVLKSYVKQVEGMERLTHFTDDLKTRKNQDIKDWLNHLKDTFGQDGFVDHVQHFVNPLRPSCFLGDIRLDDCRIMNSAKRPLWLVWKNGDLDIRLSKAEVIKSHEIIFKNGDDLRQDMLTLQVISIMDSIWRNSGLDLKMLPYTCLATGKNVGLIEVVRDAQTVMNVQRSIGIRAAYQMGPKELFKWFEATSVSNASRYELMMETFSRSCAGYCVATFVLGIGDRNPDNIMINNDGQIFHIDFGHFLGHFKKKYGINRERVPFVLTSDFVHIISRGEGLSESSVHYQSFLQLCEDAYLTLRKHSNLLITLFTLMLSTGIPELQTPDDIDYLRMTLQVGKGQEEALEYFRNKMKEAKLGSAYTKVDWFFHGVRRL